MEKGDLVILERDLVRADQRTWAKAGTVCKVEGVRFDGFVDLSWSPEDPRDPAFATNVYVKHVRLLKWRPSYR